MLKRSPEKRTEKVIKKALKEANKEIYDNRRLLGRYIIRDCYHQIKLSEQKEIVLSYCFECIDKATLYRHFYAFSSRMSKNDITVDRFVKKLNLLLNDFIMKPIPPEYSNQKLEIKDFRKIKID